MSLYTTLTKEKQHVLLKDFAFLCLGAAALLLFHHRVILGRAQFPFDYAGYHFPLLHYGRGLFLAGALPLYDPYVYSGIPLHANTNAAFFYPFHFIFYMISAATTSELTGYQSQFLNIVHFALAGAGFYALLRHYQISRWGSLVGLLLLVFNGHVLSQSQHLGVIETFSWMPISLLALEKLVMQPTLARVALLSWCLAMPTLIGFLPQAVACYFILALVVLLRLIAKWRRPRWPIALALVASGVIALALGGIAMIPVLFTFRDSVALARQSPMPLTQLLTMFAPNVFNEFDFHRYSGPVGFTVDYYYAGAAAIPLVLAGAVLQLRRVWSLIILSVISFLMTFGPDWLIRGAQSMPVIGVLIRPNTFACFFVLFALILAAHGLDHPVGRRLALPSSALVIAIGMTIFAARRGMLRGDMLMMSWSLTGMSLAATLVIVWPQRQSVFVIGLVIIAELVFINHARMSWASPGNPNAYSRNAVEFDHGDLLATMRAPANVPHRVAVNQQRLGGAWNGMWRVWGIESINGFDPYLPASYFCAVNDGLSTWNTNRTFNPGKLDSPLYSLLNVRYYLTNEELNHPDWECITEGYYKLGAALLETCRCHLFSTV